MATVCHLGFFISNLTKKEIKNIWTMLYIVFHKTMVFKYFFWQKINLIMAPWDYYLKLIMLLVFFGLLFFFVIIIILGKTKIVRTCSARGVTNQIYIQLLTVISIQTLMDWCPTHYEENNGRFQYDSIPSTNCEVE